MASLVEVMIPSLGLLAGEVTLEAFSCSQVRLVDLVAFSSIAVGLLAFSVIIEASSSRLLFFLGGDFVGEAAISSSLAAA